MREKALCYVSQSVQRLSADRSWRERSGGIGP